MILFQPTGLWELFATPAETLAGCGKRVLNTRKPAFAERRINNLRRLVSAGKEFFRKLLVDQNYEACAVVGSTVSRLRDRLAGTESFLERVRVTDNFLLSRCPPRKPVDDIAAAAKKLVLTGGCATVPDMARATGLSPRQLERRFRTYVGMAPKLYARIARFEAALNLKAVSPENTWTEIAHRLGYYDQMHMVHDFQQFSGDVPTRIARQLAMFVDGPTQQANA